MAEERAGPVKASAPVTGVPSEPQLSSAALLAALPTDELIDLYFEAEGPDERDAVFARLQAISEPVVDTFLLAMLAHDDDIFLRLAAAATLLQRGFSQARDFLVAAMHASGDDEVFEEALSALLEHDSGELFAELAQIWRDAQRGLNEQLAAMRAMERCNAGQAQEVFLAALAQTPQVLPFEASALEAMLGCFVRHDPQQATPVLQALMARLAAQDTAQASEDCNSVASALAVLAVPPADGFEERPPPLG